MSNIGIALQLFSSRAPDPDRLPELLGRLRETGFQFVQWSGVTGISAHEARAQLDAAGLKAISGQCPPECFEEDLEGAVRHWRTLGAPDVATGMPDSLAAGREAWLTAAARLDRLGARLRAGGLRLSCQHRAVEMEPFSGDNEARLDLLFRVAGPDNLCAGLDTGWLAAGGADPADCIRRFAGRCPIVHVKDVAPGRDVDGPPVFTVPGRGTLDWEDIFDAAEEAAVEWLICELDACGGDPIEVARASYAFLAERA